MQIDAPLLHAYNTCKYKAHLLLNGETYTPTEYEVWRRGGKPFGIEAVHEAISVAEPKPQAVIDTILAAQTRHRDGERADDDQTLIVIRFDQ